MPKTYSRRVLYVRGGGVCFTFAERYCILKRHTLKNLAGILIRLSVVTAGVASGPFDQDLSCARGFCLQNLWSGEEAGQSGGVHSKSTHSHVCHQSTDVLLRGGLGPLYHLSTGKLEKGTGKKTTIENRNTHIERS